MLNRVVRVHTLVFQSFTIEYDFSLSCMVFIMLKYVSSISNLLIIFIKGCCFLFNAFSASIEMTLIFISYSNNVKDHFY